MATHSSILAWRIPRADEPGGTQSIGLQRVGQDWSTLTQHSTFLQLLMHFFLQEDLGIPCTCSCIYKLTWIKSLMIVQSLIGREHCYLMGMMKVMVNKIRRFLHLSSRACAESGQVTPSSPSHTVMSTEQGTRKWYKKQMHWTATVLNSYSPCGLLSKGKTSQS